MSTFYDVSVQTDMDDDRSVSQTSCTLEGAVQGVVAKLNQAFDKYTEGFPDVAASFPELVELCKCRSWELRVHMYSV